MASDTAVCRQTPLGQVEVKSRYVIASTPRTGSYLLCESLAATGLAGQPTEPFSRDFRGAFCRMWGLGSGVAFDEYFSAVLRNGAMNGVFGVKIHWRQIDWLMQQSGMRGGVGDILERLFPRAKYIQLIRRDRRGQAISLYRASASNQWWRIPGVRNDQVTGPDPEFNAQSIRRLEAELDVEQTAWVQHFRHSGIVPIVVEYETLVMHRRDEVARILTFIGQSPAAAAKIPEPRLTRQADLKTDIWRRMLENRTNA